MPWKIEFYEKEIEKFLNSLNHKERAKILRNIGLLEKFGLKLKEPYVKSLKTRGLRELRIIYSRKIFRLIFFHWKNKIIVMLHGFVKKTQKTPSKELKTAINRIKKYKK